MPAPRRLLLPLGSLRGVARGSAVALPAASAHKLRSVLRLREGVEVHAFDGCSGEWRCTVGAGCFSLTVGGQVRAQASDGAGAAPPLLAFSPLRPERTRFLVEKATELGAGALLPVACALGQRVDAAGGGGGGGDAWASARGGVALRTAVWPEKAREWAAGAAEQCGRLSLPRAAAPAPVALGELLWAWGGGRAEAALAALPPWGAGGGSGGDGARFARAGALLANSLAPVRGLLLVADVGGEGDATLPSLQSAMREWGGEGSIAVLVGPEGGWAPQERAVFAALEGSGGAGGDLRCVTLGPLVLRADTAAVAALAQLAAARA
jgi:16S rRNA (uracil1498-N3)-methyltransferase